MTEVARLDVALVRRGLARSRRAAADLVSAGRVQVDGRATTRVSALVAADARVTVEAGDDWVGRAAVKLLAGLDRFGVDPAGALALDLGASTGGFTQVLLARGARTVIALDVGHGQLVAQLRSDPRVVVVEGENARDLDPARLQVLTGSGALPDLIVADLSFISLTLVLPAVASICAPGGDVVVLIKPQFEVGRALVRRGIVTDLAARADAIRTVLAVAAQHGLGAVGLMPSPVAGTYGNVEFLAHLTPASDRDPAQWDERIEELVRGHGEGIG